MTDQKFDHQIDPPRQNQGKHDTHLGTLDLSEVVVPEGAKPLQFRQWRMREMVIDPGGVVAFHGHKNRPAILYIQSGEIYEYHSEHKEPRLRTAGSAEIEHGDIYHWWKNEGDEPCVILSIDLFDDGNPASCPNGAC